MRRLLTVLILVLICAGALAMAQQPRDWPEERFPLPAPGTNIVVNYCEGSQQAMTDAGCRKVCFALGQACYHNYQTGCWQCLNTGEVREAKISGYCQPGKGLYYSKQACQADCTQEGQGCLYHYPNNCWQCRSKARIETEVDCENQGNVEACKYYYPVPVEELDDFKARLKQFYEQGLSELPDLAQGLIGGDTINVVIDQELGLYLLVEDCQVRGVGVGHKEEGTMVLHLEEETVEAVLRGEKGFVETLETRQSYFEGAGFFQTLKLILINFLLLLS